MPEQETIGGQTTVTCWRCGTEIKENESVEQHPEGRSHQLQQCFDVVSGQLNEMKAKAKEEVKTEPAARSFDVVSGQLNKTEPAAKAKADPLDEDEEESGKSKKK